MGFGTTVLGWRLLSLADVMSALVRLLSVFAAVGWVAVSGVGGVFTAAQPSPARPGSASAGQGQGR
ncbi:hypothetical protein [Kitasatospora sp. NPDC001527]|uniref:hypothetical protein n=1 Tax=Kitasatospora sp. NPDC001527 TaxID=3154519 RepID=UPI003326E4D9